MIREPWPGEIEEAEALLDGLAGQSDAYIVACGLRNARMAGEVAAVAKLQSLADNFDGDATWTGHEVALILRQAAREVAR